MLDLDQARALLPNRRIEWFRATGSTMLEAARLVKQGAPAGTVVGADQQTAGIGRAGHSWHSEAETGLYVSIILEPNGSSALPPLMLALGLAARDAIAEASGLDPDLRWPNDVLLHEKKCAGVMAQLELGKIVAGIGINVGQTHFPPEIGALATSLRLEGARNVAWEQLLATLVHNVDYFVAMSSRTLIELFSRASSYIIGRRVCVDLDGRSIIGMTQGLDASGFLVVREDNGKETTILAGGVRPA